MIAIGRQMTVNFRSPIPVFRQIADILLAQIDTGKLPADEPIPSQAELVERFKVARGACAKAVRTLRDAGIV
jgi:DNA-binding GntR family transcriptional regulator